MTPKAENGLWVHPAFFARSDAPSRMPKEPRRGKRWATGGGGYYEVRKHGDGWCPYLVKDGREMPVEKLASKFFPKAEERMGRFAARLGLQEVQR